MKTKRLLISDLNPATYNPRKALTPDDPEYQAIKKSVETFGTVVPILVNSDYTVISGHQRLKVLSDLGDTEVDVVVVDLDKTREKLLNVALNKIRGRWDELKLKDLLRSMSPEDLKVSGFSDKEIAGLTMEVDTSLFFTRHSIPNEKKPTFITCPRCGKEFEK